MTNNKLTDEQVVRLRLRVMSAIEFHRQRNAPEADENAELLANCLVGLDELQERRKADSVKPACYALTNMVGEVYNTHSSAQNAEAYRDLVHQSDDSLTLRVTPLYAAPQPAPDSEAQATLKRLAVIMHGSEVDLDLLTVTAQSLVDRCKTLSRERDALSDQSSDEVNAAAWKLHDMLTEYGPLTGCQFNNLKGCFYEALKVAMRNR